MITRLFLICALCLSVVPASADDPAQANRLFVQAIKSIQAVDTEQAAPKKLALLQNAFAKLNEIVEDHPSSDLAVKLITEQPIGNFSIDNLVARIAQAQAEAGDLQSALATANRITILDLDDHLYQETGASLRDQTLDQIARTRAVAGDKDGATAAMNLIKNSDLLDFVFTFIYNPTFLDTSYHPDYQDRYERYISEHEESQ